MSDCPDLTAPIVDGKELRTKIDRFVSNETRVNVFVNAPEQEEFYTTNTDPVKDVETLPHFMNRLTNETDGIVERAEGAAEESEKILEEIRSMQGMATQLESYNFGDPVSYPDFQQELTNYALQQIPEWTEPANNTRVINLWDNHEWVYNRQTSEWIDIGPARDIDIGSADFPGLTPRAPIDWKSGDVLSLKEDGSLTFRNIDTLYSLCEFYYFRHPSLKPGFQPAQGGLIENASELYPDAWEYLQTPEGQLLCKTEAEWQALTKATWATLASGTKVGWNGIGGAPFYAPNIDTGALRLPDLRGMYSEASGFDSLSVGGVHGDAIRNITGSASEDNVSGFVNPNAVLSGAFTRGTSRANTIQNASFAAHDLSFNASRVVPIANKNQPRAWGALACVYLGGE